NPLRDGQAPATFRRMTHYPNPPLHTVTAEFRFRPGEVWDMTIPGLLYENLRGTYPQKRTGRRVEVQTRMVDGQIVPVVKDGVGDLQFLTPDGQSGLKVEPESLAFQRVGIYPGWAALSKEIGSVLRS